MARHFAEEIPTPKLANLASTPLADDFWRLARASMQLSGMNLAKSDTLSNRFFSMQVYTGKYVEWETQGKNISNPDHFNKILTYLMRNITSEAAYNSSKRMFATGEVKFSQEKIIHGLVQCTRDIKEADCHSCLNQALGDLRGCCYASQGGIIVSRNCNVRFELYSFYNSSGNLLKYPTSKGTRT